jgi:cobalamin biosynthesis protein CobW
VQGKPMRLLVQAVGERVCAISTTSLGQRPRVTQLVVIAEHDHLDPPPSARCWTTVLAPA